jgi:ligand-binding SRPBCC domain-containing protein
MRSYTLSREQYLPITIEKAWAFFSSAKNLAKITPAEMQFEILTKLTDDPIYSGMEINYTVRPLLNVPLKWTTEITDVTPPFVFKDRQTKGPYALWEHTHVFASVPGGVKMTDEVKYALPLGVLGSIMHGIVVKKKLEDIFNFREKALTELFGQYKK